MANPLPNLVRRLRRLHAPPAGEPASDHALLDRYAAAGDEEAFRTLLERHGPLVRGACRRALADADLADDVFQATFLVLARKAGSVRKRDAVGAWLYGVALRLARRVRERQAAERRREERAAAERPAHDAVDHAARELSAVLDEELGRLPDRLRVPLVLCFLEGRTQDEAAHQLGWSLSTFRRRLGRGREVLR